MLKQALQARLEEATPKTLVGYHQPMSLLADATAELWQRFMQRLKARPFANHGARYSVQLYAPTYFQVFQPGALFEKWAAVEALPPTAAPSDLATLTLPGGLYAVFRHRGPASAGPAVFRYLLTEWLPASAYLLDDRPHFEVLGADYRPADPTAEEEIWLPVKPKS